MDMNLYTLMGERIRKYRKLKKVTIEQLADHLCKSKSTVSKYESGEIAITVETLCDIANFFDITPYQLIAFPQKKKTTSTPNGSFFDIGIYYCYFSVDCNHKILKGILELLEENDNQFTAQYYSTIKDFKNYYDCEHIYYGSLQQFSGFSNFVGYNQVNPTETMFINLVTPFSTNSVAIGITSAISEIYRLPMAFKFLVSKTKLSDDSLENLLFTTKNEIDVLKKNNSLIYIPTWI